MTLIFRPIIAVHTTVVCQFSVRWIHYWGSNKSTGLKTNKLYLCEVHRGAFCQFPFWWINYCHSKGRCLKFATDKNGRFTTIFSQKDTVIFYISIDSKVLTQMKKCIKTQKSQKSLKNITHYRSLLQNHKNLATEIFVFCVITCEPIEVQTRSAPQNDRLNLRFVQKTC